MSKNRYSSQSKNTHLSKNKSMKSTLMLKLIAISGCLASVLFVLQGLIVLNSSSSVLALRDYTREDFPLHFIFGSGTSAYQVEGAAFEDGRTPSILDIMAHSGRFHGNGDVACDEYHKYKDDVQLMVDTGLEAYRFSISWSRLIPNGRGPVNPKAVEYYNSLINEVLNYGIQPHVTLMHLDPPQALEEAYGGWLNPQIVKDFTAYANVCFQEFGDRVLHWTTINEPNCYASYVSKILPYTQGHNLLLGHASVARLYREKYKAKQRGFVGLSVSSSWLIPESDSKEDLIAIERVHHFTSGWFIHPLIFGDYPNTMKQALGRQLPSFSIQDSKSLKGSIDFIGINSYGAYKVKNNPNQPGSQANCRRIDSGGKFLQDVLEYIKEAYDNPPLYVHENGYMTSHNASLIDKSRVDYLEACIGSVLDATRNGTNVKGYFQWSFLDLFELPGGYTSAYGLYYVDLDDPNLTRYPKLSAHWYSTFLKGERSSSSVVMKRTRWELPKGIERILLEKNNMIKTILKPEEDNFGACYCTGDEFVSLAKMS